MGKRVRGKSRKSFVFKFDPFSRKQKQVLTWWTEDSPVKDMNGIIADGAVRSGKALSMSLSYAIWAMETFNENNFGMGGKTIGSFRRNVLNLLIKMIQSRGYSVYFYILGSKYESSQDLIQGCSMNVIFSDCGPLQKASFSICSINLFKLLVMQIMRHMVMISFVLQLALCCKWWVLH